MAAGSLVKEFCEETTCSVCLDYFKEPVIIECGHNFCHACLTQCWAKSDRGASCPHCRVFQQKNFRPNRQLANLVELVKKLEVGKGAEGEQVRCERHQEPLKLFCFDDRARICVGCNQSMEHQNHRVLPMEEAFFKYKKEIQAELQSLEQEKRKLQEQKMADDLRSQNFLTQLQAEKKKTKLAFQPLHSYLEKEEHLRLSQLEEMEKKMAKRDKENGARFSKELSHLSRLIREMEEKFQQSENDFFQDPKTILSRYVKEPEMQWLGPPQELEEALKTHAQKTPALEQALAKCQVSVERTVDEVLHKVNVTLDQETAHPQLLMSPDVKSMKWGSSRENLPSNPELFDTLPSVLGREKFTSGRHCWEVKVENGQSSWAVNAAGESVNKKGNINPNPGGGLWSLPTECYSDSSDDSVYDGGDDCGYDGDVGDDCGYDVAEGDGGDDCGDDVAGDDCGDDGGDVGDDYGYDVADGGDDCGYGVAEGGGDVGDDCGYDVAEGDGGDDTGDDCGDDVAGDDCGDDGGDVGDAYGYDVADGGDDCGDVAEGGGDDCGYGVAEGGGDVGDDCGYDGGDGCGYVAEGGGGDCGYDGGDGCGYVAEGGGGDCGDDGGDGCGYVDGGDGNYDIVHDCSYEGYGDGDGYYDGGCGYDGSCGYDVGCGYDGGDDDVDW